LQRDERGNAVAVLETNNDITERKGSEAELLRQTALLDELFVGGPDAVVLSSPDQRVVRVNREFSALFGYAEEEIVGASLADLIVPDDELERSVAARARAQTPVGRVAFEGLRRRRAGTLSQVSIKGGPMVARGRPIGYYGIYRDITQRKRAEEALQRSETYLAEGQKLSRTGSWAWSAQTKQLTHWSEEQYRMLGFDSQAGMPSDEAILARIHPGDHGRYIDDLKTAVRETSELETHYRVCLPDATVKYVHVVGHPVFNAAGDLVEYVGSSMDVTEREQAEEALREQAARLRQAEKMEAVGRLAGVIAHDFNNILGAILGYGELAQKGLEGRAVRRHVDQVMQAGARGKELVERILAFSRSGLGERVPVHVQSVVEEALEILAASLAADVRLEQRLDAGDTAVVGDATQLHQVAMNLCTNALQAMEHGGLLTVVLDRAAVPERRALSHGTLAAGPYVRLAVSDTGSGIPSTVLERMFDPFFTTKGVGEGTGLGLSLVHGIVADFGGAIDVTTQGGAGTTFTEWLPAAGETTRALTEPAADLPQGNGETVKIVDDQGPLRPLPDQAPSTP